MVQLPQQHLNPPHQSDGRYRTKMQTYAAAAAVHGRLHDCQNQPLVEPKSKRAIRTEQR